MPVSGFNIWEESGNKESSCSKRSYPDFSLPGGKADALLFVFPNIVPPEEPEEEDDDLHHTDDLAVAEYLAQAREPDPEEETVEDDEETLSDSLLTDHVISRNLRGLLKKGGVCVRADYANAPRNELTELVQQRLAFQEASSGRTGQRSQGYSAFYRGGIHLLPFQGPGRCLSSNPG